MTERPDDPLQDPALRAAFAEPLGLHEVTFEAAGRKVVAFERRRVGVRQFELAPLGLCAPPCADAAAAQALGVFLREAPQHAERVRVNLSPFEPHADALVEAALGAGYRLEPMQTHVLDLRRPLEEIRAGYHATKRSQVRRAPAAGSVIACTREPAVLDAYFSVYAASAERWGRGAPPYPRALFEALLKSPCTQLWTHHVGGRLACAMVVLTGRRHALYWQGVSHIEPDQKAAHPMARLFDEVVQHLHGQGMEHFNLGASQGLPNVQRFKEEFGARPAAYASLVHESRLWRGVKRLQEAMQGLRGGRPAGPGAGG
jgi:hypothetical protein